MPRLKKRKSRVEDNERQILFKFNLLPMTMSQERKDVVVAEHLIIPAVQFFLKLILVPCLGIEQQRFC